ncbi:MAG: hypothetical protein AAB019_01830 [Planctomycetota bacterium]
MNNKILFCIIGVLIGIIGVLVWLKIQPSSVTAAEPANITAGTANDFIALTTNTKSQFTILWLVDTKNKKLLVYEYSNEDNITLKTLRDIQYDLDIPDGVDFPTKRASARYLPPYEVKKELDKIRQELKDRK